MQPAINRSPEPYSYIRYIKYTSKYDTTYTRMAITWCKEEFVHLSHTFSLPLRIFISVLSCTLKDSRKVVISVLCLQIFEVSLRKFLQGNVGAVGPPGPKVSELLLSYCYTFFANDRVIEVLSSRQPLSTPQSQFRRDILYMKRQDAVGKEYDF